MGFSLHFAVMVFFLTMEHPVGAFDFSPLNHIQPSYRILNDMKSQGEWEENHDMNLVEEYLTTAYKNIISFATIEDERNKTSCVMSLAQLGYDLIEKKKYVLQVIDAAGKVDSGILRGNIKWNGRYYECLKAKSEYFDPKWCALTAGQQPQAGLAGASFGLSIGLCLPDSCSENDINYYLEMIPITINASIAVHCPIQPTVWTAADILSLTVFALLLALVVLGTSVDYFISWKNDKERKVISINSSDISTDNNHPKAKELSVFTKIILCFSAIKNTNAILDTTRKSGTIDCLHGIRFISISWIVLSHTYLITLFYTANIVDVADWFANSFSFQVIANGFFGVDSFFFLSGLLVAFLMLKDSSNFQGRHIPMLYLQRYLRLTPTFAFVILFIVGFYGKLGDGPTWPDTYMSGKKVCDQYWWTNVLYINNLHPSSLLGECLPVGWYLANDMQFFVLAPFSILLLKWRPKIGAILLIFGIFCSVLATGVISAHFQEQPETVGIALLLKMLTNAGTQPTPPPGPPHNGSYEGTNLGIPPTDPTEAFWGDLYSKPWCRIGVYLVGMLTGFLLHATKMKIKMTKVFVACGWLVAFGLNFSLVYGLWNYCKEKKPMTVSLAAFYNTMSRPMWGVGLGWVVVACASGNGGPINTFLSWKLFIPLSRLTFCIYLIHYQIIQWWHSTQEVTLYYSNTQFAFYFMGVLLCSVGVAYVLSLLVELPFVNLGKMILKKKEPKITVQNGDESLLVSEQTADA